MKPGCFRFVPPIAMSFVVCCCGFPGAVFAGEEAALSANFELPFYSSYTSRGQVSNDEPVLEPSLTLSKGDVTVNVWGNYNLTDRVTDDADFDEIDFTVDYALPIPAESIEMSVGVLAYTYPNTENNPSTWEVFWTVSFPELFIIPSAEIYFDVDEGDGL
ncbi:MAG TPA: hypothetical protein PLP17_15895, partial [Oligoflexia bacterium]|nr:hypothetical protein [Oligoflexia bacterium]